MRSRRYDRYGNALGDQWSAIVAGAGEHILGVGTVVRPDGSVAVAWELEATDPDVGSDVYLALFDDEGTPLLEAPVPANR